MMKKKFIASAALTAMIAAQAAMPAMAAYNADNNPYGDQHTTFGVRETNDDTLPGQVSFQVPLYVTMVARKGQTKMDVPDNYKIQNNAKANATEPNEIGVVKVTAEHLGSDWKVRETLGTGAEKNKDMTFKMGGLNLAKKLNKKATGDYELVTSELTTNGQKNVVFDVSGKVDADYKKAIAPVAGTKFANAKGDSVAVIPADGGNVVYDLDSTITDETDRSGKTDTVAVFRVVYTVAALNKTDHKPVTSVNTYIGEDAGAAGYKDGKVTNGKKN